MRSLRRVLWVSAFLLPAVRSPAAIVTATNGILTIEVNDYYGEFTIRTGALHPHPAMSVLYPVGTSDLTIRDATDLVMHSNAYPGDPGLFGYTVDGLFTYPMTTVSLGTRGFRTTYTLPALTVVQDVVINGSSLADTNVQQKVSVTNTSGVPRDIGVRFMWDWMIAGADASWFRTRDPDGVFTNVFVTFGPPGCLRYEMVDNNMFPTFSVFGTAWGAALPEPPTPPDELRYCSWAVADGSAWDFPNTGGAADSAVVYYWGKTTPVTLAPGETRSFIQYATTEMSSIMGGVPVLAKRASPYGEVAAGGVLTYTVSWSNAGTATVTALTITDTLPNGCAYASPSLDFWAQSDSAGTPSLVSAGWATSSAGPWTDGEPADGSPVPLFLRWVVDRAAPGRSGFLSFRAVVSATLSDGAAVTNGVSATQFLDQQVYRSLPVTVTVSGISLAITKTPSGWVKPRGSPLTYTLVCTCTGAATATAVEVWDSLPPGASFVSATGGGTLAGAMVVWTVGPLGPGATAAFDVTVMTPGSGTSLGPNVAEVRDPAIAPGRIPLLSNPVTVTLVPPALAVHKTSNPAAQACAGESVDYTVSWTNAGIATLTDLTITDTVAAGGEYRSPSLEFFAAPDSFGTPALVSSAWGLAAAGPWTSGEPPDGTAGPLVLRWVVERATPGFSGWIRFRVRLDPALAAGTIVRNAVSATVGGDSSVMTSETTSISIVAPALTVAKSAPATVLSGQPLTYAITVRNTGTSTAASVSLWDTIPAGALFGSASDGGTPAGSMVVWSLPGIGPGASAAVTFTVNLSVTVAGTAVGPNVACASWTNAFGAAPGTQCGNSVTVTAIQAFLALGKRADASAVPVGGLATWRLTLTSTGGDTSRHVTVWDTVPAGVSYAGCGGAPCGLAGNVVTWNVGDLAPGAVAGLSLSASVTGTPGCPNVAQAAFANSATVWQPVVTSNPVCVQAVQAALTVTLTPDQGTAGSGAPVAYTIVCANAGTDTAINVGLTDAWPGGVAWWSATPAGSAGPGGRTWSIPRIAPGGSVVVQVSVLPPAAACGGASVSNWAGATYANSAGVVRPPAGSATVFVALTRALVGAALAPVAPVCAQGSVVTFSVALSNACTDTAWNVSVRVPVPAGSECAGATGGGACAGGFVDWTVASIPPGTGSLLQFTLLASGAGPAVGPLAASVSWTGSGGLKESGSSNSATLWVNAPFLTVTKQGPAEAVVPGPVGFTISVRNTGTDTAFQVLIVDTLPEPLNIVSASPSAVVTGRIVAWSLVRLGIGESVVLTLESGAELQPDPVTVVNTAVAAAVTILGYPVRGSGSAAVTVRSDAAFRVYPNPFSPDTAVRGTVKFGVVPRGSAIRIYTSRGLLVWEARDTVRAVVEWDGRARDSRRVSPGTYVWVFEHGNAKQRGLLIVE